MARGHGVGIRDLAEELGLSVSTVSRAMNARSDASAATVERVREAAKRLGYIPNQTGRTLRGGATNAVALVMPTTTASTAAGETFFLTMANGLQEVLSGAGRDLVILPYGTSEDPDRYLSTAVDRGLADAFIVAGTRQVDPRIDYLSERGIPFVSLGRTAHGNHPWLDLDYEGVAVDSVARLASRGHHRIALGIPNNGVNNASLFTNGYRRGLSAQGLVFDPELLITVSDTGHGGDELGERLAALSDSPTAVILIQETMAIGLYRSLAMQGRSPGKDLAVIGFRKNPVLDLLSPSLTCFNVSLDDYGRRLGRLILKEMDHGHSGYQEPDMSSSQEVWPMTLVPGDSDSLGPDSAGRTGP